MTRLSDRYRPNTLDGVLGQTKVVSTIRRLIERNSLAGRAYWISGASGTGKSTLARIIASLVADDFDIDIFDSGDAVCAADIDRIAHKFRLFTFSGRGRAIIIEEAHGLRKPIIRALLGLIETALPSHSVVIFTTTRDGQEALFEDDIDAHPLLSRCTVLALTNQGLAKVFAERALAIARENGLDGKPLSAYVALLQNHRNNMRAALNAIDAGAMTD